MVVQCPECGTRYRIDVKAAGSGAKVRCSSCKTVFAASDSTAVEDHAREKQAAGGNETVLVCDDTPFFRTMVSDILTDGGYRVETAGTGEEALAKVAESKPALLVLDLQLPDMDGFEVIKRIRGSEAWKTLPILAMSGVFTDSSDVMNLQDLGADDYIGKEFKPEHLLTRVENLIERSRA